MVNILDVLVIYGDKTNFPYTHYIKTNKNNISVNTFPYKAVTKYSRDTVRLLQSSW